MAEVKGVVEPQFEGELVIGRLYWVPTVYGPLDNKMGIWPVLGPKHEDEEIIGFKWQHYHYDFRFFSGAQWDYVTRLLSRDGEFFGHGLPMSERLDCHPHIELGPVIYRRRRYQRPMPEFPRKQAFKSWLPRLEAAYANATLKVSPTGDTQAPGLICPHRGASLRGLPIVNGCITCPLHGLRWDVGTGRLVPEGS